MQTNSTSRSSAEHFDGKIHVKGSGTWCIAKNLKLNVYNWMLDKYLILKCYVEGYEPEYITVCVKKSSILKYHKSEIVVLNVRRIYNCEMLYN